MFQTVEHEADLCIVGGGLSGICAAIAAARHGAKVVIVQDRPMYGGNASSEIRMWVCGAHGMNRRETGIIEEIELENIYRNPNKGYSVWDTILFETVRTEPSITSILNCSVCDAQTSGGKPGDGTPIRSVTGWQTTTQQWHTVRASLFADCSGDSVLAPLCGAEYRVGREARKEFDESIEPEVADLKTMGMSCLIQARELDRPVQFIAPAWAKRYESADDLPHRGIDPFTTNYWWIELGGEDDSIHDTESIRDRLLAEVYGVWDLIKNRSGIKGVENLELDFIGFLPGKRESRRYVGDHVITQNDVRAGGPFDDVVAYGGWSMDDHHPAGIAHPGEPTIFHEAPSPWGIPYRALYSRNVRNLMFAGRNISATHIALSSSRVMRTCAIIGQAMGTAAALCIRHGLSPRELTARRIAELQQALMDDDCWLPGHARTVPEATRAGRFTATAGDPDALANGVDRPVEKNPDDAKLASRNPERRADIDAIEWVENAWSAPVGSSVTLELDGKRTVSRLRVVFDSDLNRYYRDMRMRASYFLADQPVPVAPQLVRGFRVECRTADGWKVVAEESENRQRLYRASIEPLETDAVRLTTRQSWGASEVKVFAFEVQ